MSLRITACLLALVVGASAVRATSVPAGENVSLAAGHTEREPVVVSATGVLTLTTPGTYTASSWTIHGELKLGAPGTYTVVAADGSIVLTRTSTIRGYLNLTQVPCRIIFAHTGDFSMASAQIDTSVAITQGTAPTLERPPLVNISTRATLAAGQTHTSGFVVGGRVSRQVLVRAIGPTLATFGVTNALATPLLTVFKNQVPIGANGANFGWGGDPLLVSIFQSVGAFTLPFNSRDAAIILNLAPGSYTVTVGGGAGEMLLEIYYVE